MGLADTADLAILLQLKGNAAAGLRDVDHALGGVHARTATVSGGIGKMSAGLGVAAARAAMLSVGLAAAVGGIALNATKAASSYEAAMELIQTQAGASKAEVDSMSRAVLALAPQVGTGPEALAAGLYHIESAGIRGAKALDILKTAAQGAKVGNADLESVTNALIAAVNSGIGGTKDFAGSMGVLNSIVGSGNMRMQDLTDAFSTGILSTAKAAGISIQSVGAAIADMTNQGVPAIDAATRLRMSISLLAAPSSKAADLFKSIGIGQLDLGKDMRGPQGILGAMTDLRAHMMKAKLLDSSGNVNTAGFNFLSQAFGGGRSSSAIITLINSVRKLGDIQTQVTKGAGAFDDAWTATQQDVDTKAAKVRASIDSLRIALGQQLLPVAANVLDALGKGLADPAVTKGITDFGTALAGMFTPANLSSAEKFVTGVIPQLGDFATSILPPLISGLRIAGQITSTAVGMFMSLPGPLQAAIIGGLAVNKLSGGLLGSGLKEVVQAVAGGATGGGAGGALGGLLGVQKVFVTNMGEGGMGGGPGPKGGIPPVVPAAGPDAAATAAGLFAPGLATLVAGIATPFIMFYAIPALMAQLNPAGVNGNELGAGQKLGMDKTANQTLVSLGLGNLIAQTADKNKPFAVPSRAPSGYAQKELTTSQSHTPSSGAVQRDIASSIAASTRAAADKTIVALRAGERATQAATQKLQDIKAIQAQLRIRGDVNSGMIAHNIARDTDVLRAKKLSTSVSVTIPVTTTVSVSGLSQANTTFRRYSGKIAAMGV